MFTRGNYPKKRLITIKTKNSKGSVWHRVLVYAQSVSYSRNSDGLLKHHSQSLLRKTKGLSLGILERIPLIFNIITFKDLELQYSIWR